MRISRKEVFSFGLAQKLLVHYEGTPLHLDMRSVLDKYPGRGWPSVRAALLSSPRFTEAQGRHTPGISHCCAIV